MRLSFRRLAAGAVLGLLLHTRLAAQAPAPARFAVEPQFSITIPRGAVAQRWGVGASLGVQASVRLDRSYALYAGYSGTRFDLDVVDDMHANDRGLAVGLLRSLRGENGRSVVPWLRVGVLAHRLSVIRRGDAGEESDPADGSVGVEAGAGIGMQRNRVRPTLGLEYRAYRAQVIRSQRETVSYAALRAGLSFAF